MEQKSIVCPFCNQLCPSVSAICTTCKSVLPDAELIPIYHVLISRDRAMADPKNWKSLESSAKKEYALRQQFLVSAEQEQTRIENELSDQRKKADLEIRRVKEAIRKRRRPYLFSISILVILLTATTITYFDQKWRSEVTCGNSWEINADLANMVNGLSRQSDYSKIVWTKELGRFSNDLDDLKQHFDDYIVSNTKGLNMLLPSLISPSAKLCRKMSENQISILTQLINDMAGYSNMSASENSVRQSLKVYIREVGIFQNAQPGTIFEYQLHLYPFMTNRIESVIFLKGNK